MRSKIKLIPFVLMVVMTICWSTVQISWIIEKHPNYVLRYCTIDKNNIRDYDNLIENGISQVQKFFNAAYKHQFYINIHPDRHSLDSTWQKDWNMPDFKSECWMVGSGVANKLDIISPKRWDSESCEHKYSEIKKTQQLITHELVHVFHGQLNSSPDFSGTEGIDWFVEGLATYVSGQCDSIVILEIKEAISNKKIPVHLDEFWTGKLRYGLSGSAVLFIDKKYGRDIIKNLLPFNKKTEILNSLKISESEFLHEWQELIKEL